MDAEIVWPGPERGRRIIQRESSGRQMIEQGKLRLVFIVAVFSLSFAAIGCRLIEIALLHRTSQQAAAPAPAVAAAVPASPELITEDIALAPLKLVRGDIVDRSGQVVATTLGTQSLFANPEELPDPQAAARALARVLPDVTAAELNKKLTREATFVWIKRNLTPTEQRKVNDLGIPGLYFQPEQTRVYPQGSLLSHVVGKVGLDNIGLSGMERFFDKRLTSAGDNGEPLSLSIDVRVQNIVRQAVLEEIKRSHALGGTGIVLDVRSGEVIALTNLPDFDPHQVQDASASVNFNRATLGTYEMGSTFKTFTTAMALDYGITRLTDTYDTTKPIQYGRYTINDTHPVKRWLNVAEIYAHSSNIGTVRMAMEVGIPRQREFLGKLGLLEPLSLELPELGRPLYPSVANWKDINMMTISYGQGISVTPLHLARAFAAVVNGGRLVPLTLIKGGNDTLADAPQVISEKTSRQMRRLMRMVVEFGTAKKADVAGYRVGGKTGTAEKPMGGAYNKKAKLALFVAAFPVDDPKYEVLIIIDEPQPTKETAGYATGGWISAPVAGEIISRIGPMLGVQPVYTEIPEDEINRKWVEIANQKFLHAVPN